MEKITIKKLILILLFLPIIGFGQNFPQGINYQAIARDTNGSVMMNQALIIQFSIISDSTTSAISWQETHPVTTNNYGLFTAVIGQGTSTNIGSSTTFNLIDWGASNHLLKVEIDYGNGYVDMGITAFMSVPYSLSTKYADTALNIRGISNRDFSNDIPSNSPGWYCIATLNPIFAGENCRGLFSIWDNTSGIREQITFYAGVSYSRGAFLDVVSHNCYGTNSSIDSIKIQSSNSNFYDPVNIYIFRKNVVQTTKLSVSLNNYLSVPAESGLNIGEWKLTPNALPISSEKNLICDLTKTKGLEPYSYTTLNKNFQGSVSRSTAVLDDDDLTTKKYVDNNKGKSIMPFYNMNLTGSSFYGGTGTFNSTNDNNYRRFESVFTTTFLTSYFGFGDYNVHSPIRPINSKFHTIEDIIVTGIYLNTPYIDVGTFSNSSAAGGLFGYGVNDYIDLEIGLPSGGTGYERIFRLGNPSSGDQDLYYFPSAGTMSLNPSGIKIVLPESDWILIPAGTNMATVLRFKYYVNDTLWIRNDYNGTLFNYSQINGYLMYITE